MITSCRRLLLLSTVLLASGACIGMPPLERGDRLPSALHYESTRTIEVVNVPVLTIEQAAQRWNLDVSRSTSSLAVLRGEGNMLLLRSNPDGSVLINGERFADDGVVSLDGTLHVTTALARRVDGLLRDSAPLPPPPRIVGTSLADAHQLRGVTVMIDAGHGGKDPGASNRWGPPEKAITLDTALRVQKRLSQWGAGVVMTRTGDTYPSLDERVAIANRVRPDLYVSIHADAAERTSAQGFTVYTARKASSASRDAAGHVVQALGTTGVPSRGHQRADYRVVAKTHSPALLVELGFLSNPAEAQMLSQAAHRQRLANAIAHGIADALEPRALATRDARSPPIARAR